MERCLRVMQIALALQFSIANSKTIKNQSEMCPLTQRGDA